jgi:hypothetical protein
MRREFIPRPGHFGEHPVVLSGRMDGSLTANNTTTFSIGGINRRAFVERLSFSQRTIAADADGTLLLTVKKRDASADSAVSLNTAVSIEGHTALESVAITLLSTLSDAQRTLDEGDTLYVEVVSNSAAIDTQPADLIVTAVLGILQ